MTQSKLNMPGTIKSLVFKPVLYAVSDKDKSFPIEEFYLPRASGDGYLCVDGLRRARLIKGKIPIKDLKISVSTTEQKSRDWKVITLCKDYTCCSMCGIIESVIVVGDIKTDTLGTPLTKRSLLVVGNDVIIKKLRKMLGKPVVGQKLWVKADFV